MNEEQNNIIIYNTDDGLSSVVLVSTDGMVWLSQMQMAKLFATSKQTVSYHISNILKENELTKRAVVKEILTTAADGKATLAADRQDMQELEAVEKTIKHN